MGRRKIEIAPIADHRNRLVTFTKRKTGLFKKAFELGVLCGAEVAVIIFAHNQKVYEYSSEGTVDGTLLRYTQLDGPVQERRGPNDYQPASAPAASASATLPATGTRKTGRASAAKGKKRQADEEDEDEDEEEVEETVEQDAASHRALSEDIDKRSDTGRGVARKAPRSSEFAPQPSTRNLPPVSAAFSHSSYPSLLASGGLPNPAMYLQNSGHDGQSGAPSAMASGYPNFLAISQQLLQFNPNIQNQMNAALAQQRMLGQLPPLASLPNLPPPNLANTMNMGDYNARLNPGFPSSLYSFGSSSQMPQYPQQQMQSSHSSETESNRSNQHQGSSSQNRYRSAEQDRESSVAGNHDAELSHFLGLQGLPLGDRKYDPAREQNPAAFVWPSYYHQAEETSDSKEGERRAKRDSSTHPTGSPEGTEDSKRSKIG